MLSGKIWLEKLKHKTLDDVADALQLIFDRAEITPKFMLSDNGSEFNLKDYLDQFEIKMRHTRAYSPQSNGIVENANNMVRKKLRELFIRNNSLNWIDHLTTVETNKNNSWNSTIKTSPDSIWTATNTKIMARRRVLPESFDKKDLVQVASANRVRQVRKSIEQFKSYEFKVGDCSS